MNSERRYVQGGRSGGYGSTTTASQRPQLNLAGEDLVDVQAVQWAEYITGKGRQMLSTHQLRRFYSEVKNIDRLRKSAPDKWADSFYPRVKLIVAKAVYNTKRQSNKISDQFKEFLESGIKPITSDPTAGPKLFEKFCLLFEAVVGYATQYTKDER